MADLLTATYDFVLPEVGGSDNTWGTKLNANFTALDLLLSSFFRGGSAGDPGDVQPFTISDAAPLLWFKETDQTAPEGYYRMGVQSDIFTLQRAVSADFVIAENVWIARGNAAVKSLEVPSPYFFHVSGGLTQVSGATPTIRFLETDAISPLGRWRIAGYGGGALSIARATAADFSAETNYLLFGFTPDVMAAAVPLTINTTSNINFQASVGASPTDLSKHLSLSPAGYGFSITASQLNYVAGSTGALHSFWTSSTKRFEIGANAGGVANATTYCDAHMAIPPTGALIFGDFNDRFQRFSGGEFTFFKANNIIGQVELPGTSAPQSYSIITKEKGDARYASVSSQRYKEAVESVDEAELAAVFDNLTLRQWTWGGELAEDDERTGSAGLGLIAEEVEEVIPDAVRYQWHEEAKRVNGLDPLALIALLVAKVRQLEDRLEDI
jgi:hypothetical protein